MRTGGCTIQQTLTAEAASVLKHSLNLARRRGHAQVTPLHVAATLLSSRTSLLRRACIKSHPGFSSNYQFPPSHHHHPFQCRALELCFNVALNRLPTVPGPMFHGQPSLANALIAALKRAQAHQRRGCIEQQQQTQPQQQPPLLTIKVELEQLVISILDDPSVSRVMREAGFSSTAVKNCIEDCSVSTVFYGSSVGVFSSPCSPSSNDQQINRFHHQNPKDVYQPLINPNTFWQTHFSSLSPQQNPLVNKKHFVGDSLNCFREDVKLVVDVLLRNKKRNPVIVGDSVSFTEGLVRELMSKIERGDVDHGDLKQTHFVKFQFSPIVLKFMRREDVETNVSELRKKVISLTSCGKGVIIYTGDLRWTVGEKDNNNNNGVQISSSSSYSPLDHIVEELGRLIAEYNKNNEDDNGNINSSSIISGTTNSSNKTRVWVMGTASYQTYMRCQMRQPSLETLWSLQAVSVPSGGLGLSLHATSGNEPRVSNNTTSQHVGAKPFGGKAEEAAVLSCCSECVSSYEREAKSFKSNQDKLLPSWLQSHGDTSVHKEELIGLRRKWNRFCQSLHQGRTAQNGELDQSNDMPYPWWSNQNTVSPDSASASFADSSLKKNKRGPNPVAKFRRQNSCTIEFDLGSDSRKDESVAVQKKSDPLGETEGTDVKITLDLGHSLFWSDSDRETRQLSILAKALQENIPWQSEILSPMAETLMNSVSSKKDAWIMINGNDTSGKRRLALAVSESLFGSIGVLVHIDLRKRDDRANARSKMLADALEKRENLVFLIEDIDSADAQFLKLLSDRFYESQELKQGVDHQAIFILTKEDHGSDDGKHRDYVLQMSLKITEQNPDRKRKPESDSSSKEAKNPRTGETDNAFSVIKREVFSRQSSFNSSLDLNIKAEESDEEEASKPGEISPISSDLTGDETQISSTGLFLGRIRNRFAFERDPKETRDAFAAKIGEIFGEIYRGGAEGVRFSIEEKVTEEIYRGCGNFLNGKFESWVKEVIGKGLLTVKRGGKKDTGVIRMVFGGIVDKLHGVDGYMGTCLPNYVQVSNIH
ncbi:PREDICTED: protein SMAX1-LIKE 5 isoform X2 [Tarenaya hassleriana]|uniref:protein SMAX1-LIKE 5 isoform X2 n=1 Tax=Tarenaya hassleriana TaxID=28532 RepID=UPI00053C6752|nr:PREDICTED: protein SMAX1-LIKE 5 isoform X2 [Tarenaya hassleriana]